MTDFHPRERAALALAVCLFLAAFLGPWLYEVAVPLLSGGAR